MADFVRFESVASLPEQTLASLEAWPSFPGEIIELWRNWGTGFIGEDGYVRVIDPAKYIAFLPEWFSDTDGAVPFLATGMGDLFVWQPGLQPSGVVRHVMYRVGHIQNLPARFDELYGYLEDQQALSTWLRRDEYPKGVERLGRPDLYEALFYTPFLSMGGVADPARLNRGDLAVSISLFTQLMGKASLIPGVSPI